MSAEVLIGVIVAVAPAVIVAAGLLLRWRGCRKPVSPTASDGSRFWGRKQAEATQGKVVTRESGGSREQAAKALDVERKNADAETIAYLRGALTEAHAWRDGFTDATEERAEVERLRAEVAHVRELAKCDLQDLRRAADRAYAERDAARSEVARLTEALREAEARAAQAVPAPAQGGVTITGGGSITTPNLIFRSVPTGENCPLWSWSDSSAVYVPPGPPRTDGTAS